MRFVVDPIILETLACSLGLSFLHEKNQKEGSSFGVQNAREKHTFLC